MIWTVTLKPDKGNSVVVLDKSAYDQGILSIISYTSKFGVNLLYVEKVSCNNFSEL